MACFSCFRLKLSRQQKRRTTTKRDQNRYQTLFWSQKVFQKTRFFETLFDLRFFTNELISKDIRKILFLWFFFGLGFFHLPAQLQIHDISQDEGTFSPQHCSYMYVLCFWYGCRIWPGFLPPPTCPRCNAVAV